MTILQENTTRGHRLEEQSDFGQYTCFQIFPWFELPDLVRQTSTLLHYL
jgi:hypothetical protein